MCLLFLSSSTFYQVKRQPLDIAQRYLELNFVSLIRTRTWSWIAWYYNSLFHSRWRLSQRVSFWSGVKSILGSWTLPRACGVPNSLPFFYVKTVGVQFWAGQNFCNYPLEVFNSIIIVPIWNFFETSLLLQVQPIFLFALTVPTFLFYYNVRVETRDSRADSSLGASALCLPLLSYSLFSVTLFSSIWLNK